MVLFCEYGTFKEMYVIQSRTIGRLGICAHLCLITLQDHSKFESDKEKNKQYMEKVMHKIQASLCNGLRIGDIVSRFSVNQFVVYCLPVIMKMLFLRLIVFFAKFVIP